MQQAMKYAPVLLLTKPLDPDRLERTVRTAVIEAAVAGSHDLVILGVRMTEDARTESEASEL